MAIGQLPTIRPSSRPWSFVEQSKLTNLLGEEDKPDVTHIYGRANGDGVPIYGAAPLVSETPGVEQKSDDRDNQVTVLVDSRASGNYFDDQLIPQLQHRPLDHVDLTVPHKILTARRSLLDGTTEGFFKGFVINEYGNQHLVRVCVLIVSGIGSNFPPSRPQQVRLSLQRFALKVQSWKATVSQSHSVEGELAYSFVLDLSVDGYAAKELAMNAVDNAQL